MDFCCRSVSSLLERIAIGAARRIIEQYISVYSSYAMSDDLVVASLPLYQPLSFSSFFSSLPLSLFLYTFVFTSVSRSDETVFQEP